VRSRFVARLFASYALLVVANALLAEFLVARFAREEQRREIEESLAAQVTLLGEVARPLLDSPSLELRVEELGAATGSRFTVTDAGGRVLADSVEHSATMENHFDRAEFRGALVSGFGTDERVSKTTGTATLYVCRVIPGAEGRLGFARAALPLPGIEARRARLRASVWAGVAIGSAAALLLAWWVAGRIARPVAALTRAAAALAEGDVDVAIDHRGRDEIGDLARAFERMAARLRERLGDLDRERGKLAVVLDGVAEGVVAVDAQERLLHCNAAARAMLGLGDAPAIGRPLVELLRAPELVEALRLDDDGGRDGGPRGREVRLHQGGRDRVLLVRAAPLPAGGAVAALLDVSELRRLETVRRDFVANVSHELKTPLAAMRGLVETLLDDKEMTAETRQRFLAKLGDQVQRLAELASDLLHLARAEADEPGARARLDLAAAAAQAVDRFAGPAKAKSIELSSQLAPAVAWADPLAVEQLLDNLVDNALKYTPSGGRVDVRTRAEGGDALLEVADNGIGIEPSEQARVFERFYRVDKARARDVPGTGLGLSIVKHLAEAHGGGVTLESWPGRGSTFRVRLPRPRPDQGEE